MKKVKFMLTAITVFAVVGGALAFKARKLQRIYCDTVQNPGVCSNKIDFFSITPRPGQQSVGSSTCTTTSDAAGDCAERPTYINN